MKTTKQLFALFMTLLAATLLFITFAIASTVDVKSKDGIGSYLTDEKGMTLYLFKKDAPDKSVCMAANGCLERWPIFYTEMVGAASGIKAGDFGTITREDGKLQTTYKGKPLYYFFKDKAPGDTNGQGVGNVWYIVAP